MVDKVAELLIAVGADTKGLLEAQKRIRTFNKHVVAASTAQSKVGRERYARLTREEAQLHKSFLAASRLTKQFGELAGTEDQIRRTGDAILSLTKSLTQAKSPAIREAAVNRYKTKLIDLRGELQQIKSIQEGAFSSGITKAFRNMESAAVLAIGPLSAVGARVRSIGAIAGRSAIGITALVVGITALTAGFAVLSTKLVAARRDFDRIHSALFAATESSYLASRSFNFIKDISIKLGVNLSESAKQFARLQAAAKGSNITLKDTEKLYKAVAFASTALKLTTGETAGIFRAFQQMISKGTVQAEELRGQLGDRLPGALPIAAKALGVTTKQLNILLKQGKVLAENLIPKMADVFILRFAGPAERASHELASAEERLRTQFFGLATAIDKVLKVSDAYKASLNGLNSLMGTMEKNIHKIVAAILSIGFALQGLLIFKLFGAFSRAVKTPIKDLTKMQSVMRSLVQSAKWLWAAFKTIVTLGLIKGIVELGLAFTVLRKKMLNLAIVQSLLSGGLVALRTLLIGAAAAAATYGVYKVLEQKLADVGEGFDKAKEQVREFLEAAEEIPEGTQQAAHSWVEVFKEANKETTAQIRELEARIKRIRNEIFPIGPFQIRGQEDIGKLQEKLNELREANREYANILGRLNVVIQRGDSAKNSEGYETITEKIRNLVTEIGNYENLAKKVSEGKIDFAIAEQLVEPLKGLDTLKESGAEHLKLLAQLKEQGIITDDVAEGLAILVVRNQQAEKAFKALGKSAKNNLKPVMDMATELQKFARRRGYLERGLSVEDQGIEERLYTLSKALKTVIVDGNKLKPEVIEQYLQAFREGLEGNLADDKFQKSTNALAAFNKQLQLLITQNNLLAVATPDQVDQIKELGKVIELQEHFMNLGFDVAEAWHKAREAVATLIRERKKYKELTGSEVTSEANAIAKIEEKIAQLRAQGDVLFGLTSLTQKQTDLERQFTKVLEDANVPIAIRTKLMEQLLAMSARVDAGKEFAAAGKRVKELNKEFDTLEAYYDKLLRDPETILTKEDSEGIDQMIKDLITLEGLDLRSATEQVTAFFIQMRELRNDIEKAENTRKLVKEIEELTAAYTEKAAILNGTEIVNDALLNFEDKYKEALKKTTLSATEQAQALAALSAAKSNLDSATNFNETRGEIDELITNIHRLRELEGTGAIIDRFLDKAVEKFRSFGPEHLQRLVQQMLDSGLELTSTTAEELYAELTRILESLTSKGVQLVDEVDSLFAPLEDSLRRINELLREEHLLLAGGGTEGVRLLKKRLQIERDLIAARKQLIKLGKSPEQIEKTLRQLEENLTIIHQLEESIRGITEWVVTLENAFDNALGSVGDQLAHAFATGEKAAIKFRDVVESVLEEVYKKLIRQLVTDPLVQLLSTFASILGQNIYGFFNPSPTAQGIDATNPGAPNSGVQFAAKGMVLPGPTMFRSGGRNIIGGEAGSEALIPLKRLSGGRLGVSASGLGGETSINVVINNNDAQNNEVNVRRQPSPDGESIIVDIERQLASRVSRGGPLASSIRDVSRGTNAIGALR